MSTIKSSDEHLTLNADGSSKDIKFQANGVEKASISSSGAFTSTTIDATKLTGNLPAVNGSALTNLTAANLTGALPAISGASLTGIVSDNLPAFYAYKQSSISIPHNVTTTLLLDEEYDPNSAYSASTGRFTPQTAGIYLILASTSWHVSNTGTLVAAGDLHIRKNTNSSALVTQTWGHESTGMINYVPFTTFAITNMNGTSDYVYSAFGMYNYTNTTATNAVKSGFSAFLIKAD